MKEERPIWQRTRTELFRDLGCTERGLTTQEAEDRLKQYGPNELQEGGKKSTLRIFLEQFADFIVIILILAAIVSAFTGEVESTIVILAVITMNAVLGTVQTVKAAASLDSLKQMSAPTAKVLRDGQILQVPGREITLAHVIGRPDPCVYTNLCLEIGFHADFKQDGRSIGILQLSPPESAVIAADVAVKAGAVDVGFMDRFSGALIVTGARAEVDAAIEENVRFFRDDLHYRVCPISEQ